MFRTIDDFLIDRVCQPIADVLDRWVSCYGIARFLIVGYAVAHTVHAAPFIGSSALGVFNAVLPVLWTPEYLHAARMDRARPSDVLPNERIWRVTLRAMLLFLIFVPSVFFIAFINERWDETVECLGWQSLVVAMYFMACRKRPPRRKAARTGWFMGLLAGSPS